MQKLLIDYFAATLTLPESSRAAITVPVIVFAAVLRLVLINGMLDSVDTISGFEFASLRDRIQGHLRVRVFETIASFHDITLFESPKLLDTKQAALQAIPKM